MEERQQEYHRARARIFGAEAGGMGGGGYPVGMQQPPQMGGLQQAQRGPVYGVAGLPASPVQAPFPMSPPRGVA